MNIKNIYLNFVGRYSINVIVWAFGISLIEFDKYLKTQGSHLAFSIMIDYAMYCGPALLILFLLLVLIEQKLKFRITTKWLVYNPLYIIALMYGLYWTVIFIGIGTYLFIDENIMPISYNFF